MCVYVFTLHKRDIQKPYKWLKYILKQTSIFRYENLVLYVLFFYLKADRIIKNFFVSFIQASYFIA